MVTYPHTDLGHREVHQHQVLGPLGIRDLEGKSLPAQSQIGHSQAGVKAFYH